MRQVKKTPFTPAASATSAETRTFSFGTGGLNSTLDMTGGRLVEKLSLRRPGVPAGPSRAGSFDPAQLETSSPGEKGQMRSREAEWPLGPTGQGARSEYLTASTTWPEALHSSSFSP